MKKRTRSIKKGKVTVKEISYRPIGIIHTLFKGVDETPHQPNAGKDVKGMIEIEPEYAEGLSDIEGFSKDILIYHFHLSVDYSLKIKPYRHDHIRGVFATRSPRRPNPIGMSIVRLVKIDGEKIYVRDIDVVDGTPLLDIKPYIPEDSRRGIQIGWLSGRATSTCSRKR